MATTTYMQVEGDIVAYGTSRRIEGNRDEFTELGVAPTMEAARASLIALGFDIPDFPSRSVPRR